MAKNTKRKALTGASAAALLLLGGVYAWNNTSQHKTNEFSNSFKDNDVTLVEDFVPIIDWAQGQTVNKDISVKNNTNAATGSSAYVRISLKEFLEFTNKTENLSTIRYAVTTSGDFAKFDNQTDAQTYATANGLDAPVQVPTTAYEGSNKWFIPTKAGATHGQYGKFLVLSVGGGTPKSIIDANVAKASNVNHQALTHAEDAYTTQLFKNGGKDINLARYYDPAKLVTDYPTGAGIEKGKDLKDYITWSFGPNVTTLADFDPTKATTAQWVIDTATGWVYWSDELAPTQSTTHFLDSVTLSQSPRSAALYYAIHTNLEAVDFSEIDTLSMPPKIKDAWKKPKIKVRFKDFTGSQDVLPAQNIQAGNPNLAIPAAPKPNEYFLGWATKANAAKTETLYMAAGYNDIQHKLSDTDKKYLGYELKPEHEIKNIQADRTLYAVYYKKLASTGQAYATNPKAQEFIWNEAIWRVLNADGDHRLVIKVSALTEPEVTGLGFMLETGAGMYQEEGTRTKGGDALGVHFHSQNGATDTDDEKFFANSATDDGYSRSRLKSIIDAYYQKLGDKTQVLPVGLNLPNFTAFKKGLTFDKGSDWNDWDMKASGQWFIDTRFKTLTGGNRQAFALSYGDINTTIGQINGTKSPLLDFTGSNWDTFWLRSFGYYNRSAGIVQAGRLELGTSVHDVISVRPALYLAVN